MSLQLPKHAGPQLFKEGYSQLQGIEDAIIRNIEAVHGLTNIVRTSFGCHGRKKFIVNHLQKIFLTSDATTIMRELDVVHPAAKLLIMASQQQETEMGDATNLVIILGGELLLKAESLLRMGLHPSEIIQGYETAAAHAQKLLEELAVDRISDPRDSLQLTKAIKTTIAAKQYGNEGFLSGLVSEAVLEVLPKNTQAFNVDNVRVVKVLGGSLTDSKVVKGMVFNREPEGLVTKVSAAKVAVFSCPIDIAHTETKGTVLLKNAKEMLNFSKGEETQLEYVIKEIHDSGIRIVITGSSMGELALHYINRYNLFAIKILSKFDLRRLCRVINATPLARLGAPMPDEMGFVDYAEVIEIGGDRVTVFRQEGEKTKTSTVVIRGATQNYLDDIEHAIDDGVNVVKALLKDSRLLPGAGATEMELVKRILAFGEKTPGLQQHSIKKFAEAFEVVPRTLADNAGMDATEKVSFLMAAHHKSDDGLIGIDVEEQNDGLVDAKAAGIFDVYSAKSWAIRLATDAATSILSIDQIIMAKPAGGPKVPQQGGDWDQD